MPRSLCRLANRNLRLRYLHQTCAVILIAVVALLSDRMSTSQPDLGTLRSCRTRSAVRQCASITTTCVAYESPIELTAAHGTLLHS